MVPLYAARVSDLGPGDFVRVWCVSCGHEAFLPPTTLLHGLHLRPETLVLDLEPKLRCRECDEKGKALVSVRWGTNEAKSRREEG